jgi:Uncharacterized protein conserved in bacteria
MSSKKIIIPVFIVALLLGNFFIPRSSTVDSSSQNSAATSNAEIVDLQQQLNDNGFWIGACEGLLGSKAYQEAMQLVVNANLASDGLVGLRTRQAYDLAAINATSASAQVPEQTESDAAVPAASVNQVQTTAKSDPVKVAEKTSSTVSRGSSSSSRTGKVITMVATGYDGCYECNKPYYGYPSYIGLPLQRGIVAVDPDVIAMGTRLYVEGYGEAIAADQGNAIKGNRIDLFFDSHQEASNYGIKTVKVTILGN